MKRVFDLVISILILVILAPCLGLIAILIRINLGTPIVFRQLRPGLYGEPFKLYKFRTMTDDRDQFGHLLPDSQRLTPLGGFLRKFSLDEIIQLFNVMKGDISLVGPRPLLIDYLPLYTPEQAKRHNVRPGITGWAQINGRNAITWEEKFRLDVWYVQHHTLLLDIKILWITFLKVIKAEGISQPGQMTTESFKGSSSGMEEVSR